MTDVSDTLDNLLYSESIPDEQKEKIRHIKNKFSIAEISELLWRVSHDEPGISHERAEELANNFIDT